MTAGASVCRVGADGLQLGYVSRGSGPLVIFIHGFPDTYRSFLPIIERVASAGYQAVAMALRGYGPSELAPRGDYRVEDAAADVLALADALGARRFSIVGHDWGAVTGYAAANLAPERIDRLITAAVPHTGHFLLGMGPRQLLRSRYMLAFQLPWLPEANLARDDFDGIDTLIQRWSPDWHYSDADVRPLKDNYAEPGRLGAALAWYRQLPRSLASQLSRRLIFSPVRTPTRIIYGFNDGCIGSAMFQGQQKRFLNGLDMVMLANTGHFMHCEQPALFARLVIEYLNHPMPPGAAAMRG